MAFTYSTQRSPIISLTSVFYCFNILDFAWDLNNTTFSWIIGKPWATGNHCALWKSTKCQTTFRYPVDEAEMCLFQYRETLNICLIEVMWAKKKVINLYFAKLFMFSVGKLVVSLICGDIKYTTGTWPTNSVFVDFNSFNAVKFKNQERLRMPLTLSPI